MHKAPAARKAALINTPHLCPENVDWASFVEWHLYNYAFHKSLLEKYREQPAPPAFAPHVSELRWYVSAIEDVLPMLLPGEMELVQMRYFAREPEKSFVIAEKLFISRSALYRRRSAVLAKFARRFGLAPAAPAAK